LPSNSPNCEGRVVATDSGLDGVELVREMGADLAVEGKH
jgi:hypothetical protein